MPQPFHDDYMCQKCATIKDSGTSPPVWRPDITGNKSAGNLCPACLKTHNSKLTPTEKSQLVLFELTNWPFESLVLNMIANGTPYDDCYFVVSDCLDALIIEAARCRDLIQQYQDNPQKGFSDAVHNYLQSSKAAENPV